MNTGAVNICDDHAWAGEGDCPRCEETWAGLVPTAPPPTSLPTVVTPSANHDAGEAVARVIERRIYRGSADHKAYMTARFTDFRGQNSFELDGHRWAYRHTSFDDNGDFDLIYRHADALSASSADRVAELEAQLAESRERVARAYGLLWHVNAGIDAPWGTPSLTPERAAMESRKVLRDMLTSEQRGDGINAARDLMKALAANQEQT